jgi:hypothetical protein
MIHSHDFDPVEVLGVSRESSLEQIRDAYRAKTKKHHPDAGGDEWAFRLVVKSYELLSQARVAGYFAEEDAAPASKAAPAWGGPKPANEGFSVRKGIKDKVAHPTLLVEVEALILRRELDNPYEVITASTGERNLSCSLAVQWPAVSEIELEGKGMDGPRWTGEVIQAVGDAVKAMVAEVVPGTFWEQRKEDTFNAVLGFRTARGTSDAIIKLRAELKARGLGIVQITREIVLPMEEGEGGD